MRRIALLGLLAVALLAAAGTASAASLGLVEAGGAKFPDRAYILSLPSGRALDASQLKVLENGLPVQHLEATPQGGAVKENLTVVLAIDASNSMAGKPISEALRAARSFASQQAFAGRLGVVVFDGSVAVLAKPGASPAAINAALAHNPKLGNGTRIYDALDQSAGLITATGAPRGAVVLLSDGADVGSHAQSDAVLAKLQAAHVRVFTVGLASKAFDPGTLTRISSTTGASSATTRTAGGLVGIFDAVGRRLASEYILRWRSVAGEGQNVAVHVTVPGVGSTDAVYETPGTPAAVAAETPSPKSGGAITASAVLYLFVAILVSVLIGLAVLLLLRARQSSVVDRVGRFVDVQTGRPAAMRPVRNRRLDALGKPSAAVAARFRGQGLAGALELAGMTVSPTRFIVFTAIGSFVLVVFGLVVLGPLGLLFVLIGPLVARSVIRSRTRRRRRAFADQLPDNLDLLASALRMGNSLVGGLSVVAADASEPSASEFSRVVQDAQLGVLLEDALKRMADRMGNRDLDQVALVARLQRELGSNSAEVLDRVIAGLRADKDLRRLVFNLTAQGRLTRWVLTGLPVALALGMSVLSSSYMRPLFTTSAGRLLLLLAGVMIVSGWLVIGKIVDVEV